MDRKINSGVRHTKSVKSIQRARSGVEVSTENLLMKLYQADTASVDTNMLNTAIYQVKIVKKNVMMMTHVLFTLRRTISGAPPFVIVKSIRRARSGVAVSTEKLNNLNNRVLTL